jgi:prepilin-type processing-associated H-X9-DG protein
MVWREQLKLVFKARGNGKLWFITPSQPIDSKFDGYLQRLVTLLAYPAEMTFMEQQRESSLQIRQLSLGVLQFVQDFDEKFAFTPQTFKAAILPYLRDEDIWTAPGDAEGKQSYAVNPELANVTLDALQRPADTVMIYLGQDMKPDLRYGGKTVVGFADGHVSIMDAEAVKKLRWKP